MQSYLWVTLGSAFGGMARAWCSGLLARRFGEAFPWGTLAVNIVGSFVIGLADAVAAAGSPARQLVIAGLCGGFTTFSAFSLQTLFLFRGGQGLSAAANVGASVVACLAAVWIGHLAGAVLHGVALVLPR